MITLKKFKKFDNVFEARHRPH